MKLRDILAAIAMLSAAVTAQAQSAGDFILSAGWNHFRTPSGNQPVGETSSGDVSSGPFNSKLSLGDADTFGLAGTYFFTNHIAGELALSTPARFDVNGIDAVETDVNLTSLRQKNASLLLKYYFFDAQEKFRPYVGIGISRVWFDNQTFKPDVFTTQQISFKNKWAPVLNGGLSYQFNKNWIGSFSISYIPLKTTANTHISITSPEIPDEDAYVLRNKTQIKLNPVITQLSIGYRF